MRAVDLVVDSPRAKTILIIKDQKSSDFSLLGHTVALFFMSEIQVEKIGIVRSNQILPSMTLYFRKPVYVAWLDPF